MIRFGNIFKEQHKLDARDYLNLRKEDDRWDEYLKSINIAVNKSDDSLLRTFVQEHWDFIEKEIQPSKPLRCFRGLQMSRGGPRKAEEEGEDHIAFHPVGSSVHLSRSKERTHFVQHWSQRKDIAEYFSTQTEFTEEEGKYFFSMVIECAMPREFVIWQTSMFDESIISGFMSMDMRNEAEIMTWHKDKVLPNVKILENTYQDA